VIASSGHEVWGLVWQLTDDDLARLDGYELGYWRCSLEVIDDAGAIHIVASYSVVDKGAYDPSHAYLEKMLRWGAHWRFPEAYLDQLRRVATADPSTLEGMKRVLP